MQDARDRELEAEFGDERIPTRRTRWSAADLMAADFPEARWAIPRVVPEGLTLFAGPPKIGKSWLMLGAAVAVASGGKAFGSVDVEQGGVLYVALEDPARRLAQRLAVVLEGSVAPAGLDFATTWPLLHDGGADQLDEHLDEHVDTRLVVVDVFVKARGTTSDREDRYQADYRAMSWLKEVADRHQVAVVAVHHVRKQASEDFVDTVSGTNGLAGAADTILVLARSRGAADAKLHVTGRDVDEHEHAMKLVGGRWTLLDGPASDYDASDQRRRILHAVREEEGLGPKAIADVSGIAHDVVKHLVRKMVDAGQLDTDGDGRYFAPLHPVHSVHSHIGDGEQGERGEHRHDVENGGIGAA